MEIQVGSRLGKKAWMVGELDSPSIVNIRIVDRFNLVFAQGLFNIRHVIDRNRDR